jgi:hypothetical protein
MAPPHGLKIRQVGSAVRSSVLDYLGQNALEDRV